MLRQIRATFDRATIVVYQAYNHEIAEAALAAGKLVAPFSLARMTWIKPGFLGLMERTGWARKPNQERVLALRIGRDAFEKLLAEAVPTHHEPDLYPDADAWRRAINTSRVHVQWDPERDLRGNKLGYRSIQVGIGRELIEDFALRWIREITDVTPVARAMKTLLREGKADEAERHLPEEQLYPLPDALGKRLGVTA